MIIDAFAGGGGASTGSEMALGRPVDIAINHDPQAIIMHTVNHPSTLHLTEDIFKVNLQKYVGNKHVDLLWASPDCTHFSKAKGDRPLKKEIRMLPMAVVKHAKKINPDIIIMENVEEIKQWGPLNKKGRPIVQKSGTLYKRFLKKMYLAGYTKIETKVLTASDYGAPTSRTRWYAIFRRDGRQIIWPEPTHNRYGTDGLQKWVPISEVLDFKNLGKSIFGRKKPLAEKTMDRIARGLQKFVFENPEPFVTKVQYDMAINTDAANSCDTSRQEAEVMSFLTKFYKSGTGQSLSEPIHTITTSPGHFGLVSAVTVKLSDLLNSGISPEVAQKCTWVSNFIMEYYGCGTGQTVDSPLHTIVTKDRFALITVLGNDYAVIDIRLRMLTPEELKLGQGFPKDYIIDHDINGKPYPIKEQVARIGNSVVPIMAQKLIETNCPYLKVGERVPNLMIDYSQSQLRFA